MCLLTNILFTQAFLKQIYQQLGIIYERNTYGGKVCKAKKRACTAPIVRTSFKYGKF